ncbi:hypothetical protein NP233_g12407 [Leucocoprinus birnbaumii]|uniref:Uncharacterized protein n=1 Tax=Leucocoprinus birnbaumii TaxID=56174 RepID=A0AAD5VF46_9AGAR|nr:hypothetical protein NP233_g12407 [Leucocoprinus birnbaumii]
MKKTTKTARAKARRGTDNMKDSILMAEMHGPLKTTGGKVWRVASATNSSGASRSISIPVLIHPSKLHPRHPAPLPNTLLVSTTDDVTTTLFVIPSAKFGSRSGLHKEQAGIAQYINASSTIDSWAFKSITNPIFTLVIDRLNPDTCAGPHGAILLTESCSPVDYFKESGQLMNPVASDHDDSSDHEESEVEARTVPAPKDYDDEKLRKKTRKRRG